MAPDRGGGVAMFVSWRAPGADGDGGNHRSYQILLDVEAEFGRGQVHTINVEDWLLGPEYVRPSPPRGVLALLSLPRRASRRVARMTENPYKLLSREGWSQQMRFGTRGVLAQEFIAYYSRRLRSIGHIDVCVVDHPTFDPIRVINSRLGIPTLIASHNIESLDVSRMRFASAVAMQTVGIDLANELRTLGRFAARLAISKVEAALIAGVGLTCGFYPYLPVGQVRAQLREVMRTRLEARPDPGLFLLMGSASHPPTRRSIEWFIGNAVDHRLPSGARVVVVGKDVRELAEAQVACAGLEFRGRVSESELFDLLVHARAALVPQRMGFGALTRIPELACAGVPVIVFPHAMYAMDMPPGVHLLPDDSWSSMADGICGAVNSDAAPDHCAYPAWEREQARPLGPELRKLGGAAISG